jgi:hypothetical protein
MNGMNGEENGSPIVILSVISKVGGGKYRAMCEELRGSGLYPRIEVSDPIPIY